MDTDWAEAVLDWWIKTASSALSRKNQNSYYSFGYRLHPKMPELRERNDQTRRVIARILESDQLPVLLGDRLGGDFVDLAAGIDTAQYALGRLRTDAETRSKIGSTAPTMAADALHPIVWEAASGRWNSGHHLAAVQRAATFLNTHIQDRTKRRDVSETELMQQVFSLEDPKPGKPRLRWPGDSADLTTRAMRIGILNFAQGVYSAIRNPATHSTKELERQEALEQLAVLSTLARWVDCCELLETPAVEPPKPGSAQGNSQLKAPSECRESSDS